jgi:MinD superfamily P-loop ATPase
MKELVVISGKGGTGKTSVVASFAALAERPVLADCDVDAADLHLVLSPTVHHEEEFSGGKEARILPEKCTGCGTCLELCRFDAIKETSAGRCEVDRIACEGCGVCAWFCPEKAIEFGPVVNGKWFVSDTRFGPMVHARLGVAEENSGKLVTLVRNQAKKIAEEGKHPYLIADGAPGIGCPVIASITGADLVLVVTEPTVAGVHDLERVADLTKHFGIPTAVCVNKSDLNTEGTDEIARRASARGLELAGRIRYDKAVTAAQVERKSVVEHTDGPVAGDIKEVWRNVAQSLGGEDGRTT